MRNKGVLVIPYNVYVENGFDIIPPEKAKLERKDNDKWSVKYLSSKTLEWVEDPHEPEVTVNKNKETTIYKTFVRFQQEDISKEYFIYRTEEGNTVTHELRPNPSGHVIDRKDNGVPHKNHLVKSYDKIKPIEDESLAEITNWKFIASSFIEKNPFYYDNTGVWWRWNHINKNWEITDETDLLIAVDAACRKNTLPSGERSKAMEALRREARERCPVPVSGNWVQFGDIVCDVETGERFSASPKYFITNPIPHCIGEDISTPILDKYLSEWAGDKAHTLKQLLAFCTLPSYAIQRIFFLIGGGSNGKSTYLAVLRKFIGINNVCSAGFDEITDSNNKFATSALYKKTVCEMGETGFTSVKKTEVLKRLSSGQDLTKAEFKGKGQFEFINYAKIVIASNSLPESHDKTDGFYRRWIIIDFPNQFEEKKDILKEIPDKEYQNLALWSINELQNLLRERKFYKEGSIADRREEYEKRSDPLGDFIRTNYEPSPAFESEASTFYAEYEKYSVNRSIRVMSYRVWKAEMKHRGYGFEKKRMIGYENPIAVVVGLKRIENNSVPDVPVVPDVSIPYMKKILNGKYGTSGTTGTISVEKSTLTTLYEEFGALFTGEYSNKPMEIDKVQKILSELSDEIIQDWLMKGKIIELPAGWIRPT